MRNKIGKFDLYRSIEEACKSGIDRGDTSAPFGVGKDCGQKLGYEKGRKVPKFCKDAENSD